MNLFISRYLYSKYADVRCVCSYLIHWPVAFAPNKGNFPMDANNRIIWDEPSLDLKVVWGVMEEFQKVRNLLFIEE